MLDSNSSVKEAVITPPARKMLVRKRKVKAACMQKEQEAAASAVVVNSGQTSGQTDTQPAALPSMVPLSQQGLSAFSSSVENQALVPPPPTLPPLPPPPSHLMMEQGYSMVSSAHPLLSQPSASQPPSSSAPETPVTPLALHPFPHLSHPPIDYSHIPGLSTLNHFSSMPPPSSLPPLSSALLPPGSLQLSVSNSVAVSSASSENGRPDLYSAGSLEGNLQPQVTSTAGVLHSTASGVTPGPSHTPGGLQQGDGYTTSPFSFIQNFLMPSVGVANLLDLAHASGAK